MFIFEKDKYFPSCHASTLVKLEDGGWLAAWFGGTQEKNKDVDIWISRFHNGGWSAPVVVAGDPEEAFWNPVLFAENGVVHLFYRRSAEICDWRSYCIRSTDNGASWTEPERLPKGFLGPIKNKPVRMSNGEWLCGSSVEPEWECRMEVYNPQTNCWSHSAPLAISGLPEERKARGIIQPAVWESTPGNVHTFMRSSENVIYRSDSSDYGKTWSEPEATVLPNNNSGLDAVRLASGDVALIYNPVPANWGVRTPLVIDLSPDNGQSWNRRLILEDEPGEYSYPGIVADGDALACVYTHKRKQICFRRISPNEFSEL